MMSANENASLRPPFIQKQQQKQKQTSKHKNNAFLFILRTLTTTAVTSLPFISNPNRTMRTTNNIRVWMLCLYLLTCFIGQKSTDAFTTDGLFETRRSISQGVQAAAQQKRHSEQKLICHKKSTTNTRKTITQVHQSETDVEEGKGENVEEDGESLLKRLDETFTYDGRLPMKENFRCGFVSILGAPNMGKSTLLNALLQENLCIATRRPQTTRHAILGVLTTKETQLCLIDTPGIIEDPAYKLQEGMMEAVMGAFRDSDVLLVVTDLYSTPIPDDTIFQKVCRSDRPVIVVINKIDLVGKANPNTSSSNSNDGNEDEDDESAWKTYTVPDAVARWRSIFPEAVAIIPLAASEGPENVGVTVLRKLLLGGTDVMAGTGDGDSTGNDEDDLPSAIRRLGRPVPGMFRPGVKFITNDEAKQLLPLGPPLYEEDILTDRSERYVCSSWPCIYIHIYTSIYFSGYAPSYAK